MGYRSDVTIVFYTRTPTTDVPFAALKLWFDENYPTHEAIDEWGAKVELGDDFIMVTYEDVKWYDSYDHPARVGKAIDLFTDTFEANDHDKVAYETVRIGEEMEDIEMSASNYSDWRLDVSRTVNFR